MFIFSASAESIQSVKNLGNEKHSLKHLISRTLWNIEYKSVLTNTSEQRLTKLNIFQ